MKLIGLGLVLLALVSGCKERRVGPVIEEPGKVRQCIFAPDTRTTVVIPIVDGKGRIHMSTQRRGKPAQHVVVFECQHGAFWVDNEEVFNRVHEGEEVTIQYKEIEEEQEDGSFKVVAYDFVDAWPKAEEGGK